MRLRTQFLITILLFGIILVVIAASAIITNQQIEKVSEQEDFSSSIAQGANELSYLTNDYLIYRESQQLKRWQSRFASFSSQVASLHAERPDQQALVTNIRANKSRLKEVFDSVASAVGGPPPNRSTALDPAFLQVSWSRMAVQSQGLVSDASRLSQLLRQQMDQLITRRAILIYIMVGLFGVFLLASYMLTYKRILKSLATLQAGTAVIGSGNLDFVIREKENDEIGDLSKAFNRMTANLKAVTASKTDLEREIHERKRVEEALRASEQRWATTLASIGDGVIATDVDGRITFMNAVAEGLTGWTHREASQKPATEVFTVINEQTREAADNPVSKVLREGNIVGLANHTVLIRKDGTEVAIDDSGAPIKDKDGKIVGVVLVFRDITERRRAEETLRQSETRLRLAQVSAGAGMWDWDMSTSKLEWSEELFRLFGLDPKRTDASFDFWESVLHPDDRVDAKNRIETAIQNRTPLASEYRIVLPSGEVRWINALGNTTYDNSSKPQRMSGICIDITERKHIEEEIERLAQQRQLALDAARMGWWHYDPITRILLWDEGYKQIFGVTGYQQPKDQVLSRLHPEDLPGVWAKVEAALDPLNPQPYSAQYRINLPDGSMRWIEAHGIASFEGDGEKRLATSLVGTVADITGRKHAEELLRKSHEELEMRVKERTIELSEALETLRAENIQRKQLEDTLRESESQVRFFASQYLKAQETERKRIAGELHDSIVASLSAMRFRIEKVAEEMKQGPYRPESFRDLATKVMEINNEVRRIMADLRPSILDDLGIIAAMNWFCREYQKTYSHISVEQQIGVSEPEVPDSLKTPIFRISQEAMNNVAKYSRASFVNLSLRKENHKILLTIQDNGQGFDLETVGRGLGLSTMRERAQLSGGSFELETAMGRGTQVRVSWPLGVGSQ
jgi:PAS domain S-box-containing protein